MRRSDLKKKDLHAAEQDRPDVRHKRAVFCGRSAGIDPARFVFLDETGAHTALTRLYGRGQRGQRVRGSVPEGHWRTTTLVSAIRQEGVVAALVYEGATDEAAFLTFVRQVLVPALRPRDIVVLDNLAAHKVKAVARVLRRAGMGVWYLPPYSPDLNPIEKIWSKVKAHLRRAAARTTETLWEAITQALEAITPQDCQNSFAHCGYPATPKRKML